MPLLDIQRQAVEMGRIRLGTSTQRISKRTGKPFKQPQKLSSFRFTTPSPRAADAVAELLGGNVQPWERGQYEVVTDCTELPVTVPPGDAWGSQHYELWKDRLCQRRCDGVTEQLTGQPCLCPPAGAERAAEAAAGRACKPTTRINVILPDLPGLGVWRLESRGFYAAVELGGAVELLAQLRAAGQMVPAILRLERREALRVIHRGSPEEKVETREFYVPVVEILTTVREMAALGSGGRLADALPPAPSGARAITAAPAAEPPPVREPVREPAAWQEERQTVPAPDAPASPPGGLPAQPPGSAQELYRLAIEHPRMVPGLRTRAGREKWLDEWVATNPDDPQAAWETLADALTALEARS